MTDNRIVIEQPIDTGPNAEYSEKQNFISNPWSSNQTFQVKQLKITVPNTEQSLYIYNINTREEFLLNLIPDQLAESYAPKIITQNPFGVLHPLNYYVGGEEKQVSFSFTIFEDYHNVDGSIYKLMEKFKGMSRPVVRNGALIEPKIYIQLGNQFAGKGHITTDFEYQKPFRQGRYTNIACSLSFIFHEEFDDAPIVLQDGSLANFGISPLATDLSSISDSFESYADFNTNVLDYDAIITQIYTDSKLTTFLNLVRTQITSTDNGYQGQAYSRAVTDFWDNVESGNRISQSSFYNNPFGVALINLFADLKSILRPIFDVKIIEWNLRRLLDEAKNLNMQFLNSYYKGLQTQLNDGDYGWYQSSPGVLQSPWLKMGAYEKDLFRNALASLISIVSTQINVYEISYGAGA